MGKKTRRGYLSQFPAHWKVYRMDKLLDRVKKKVDVKKTENYTQIGIRSHGKGIFYKEAVTGKELGNKSVFWVEPDCFVVNIVFAWEMAVAKTTQNDVGLIASHRFPMYKPKPELLDLDFLLYYFKMPLGKYLLGLASPGGAGRNKTLGQKEFAELEICIPPVDEQKEIVSILKTWDKAIDLKEKLIEEKKLHKIGLMQQLLSGEKRFDSFTQRWQNIKIAKIVELSKGKALSLKDIKDGEYPVIAGGKTSPYYHNEFTHQNVITISASGANAGFVSYHKNKIWASDCSVIKEKKNYCNIEFIFQVLKHKQELLYSFQTGGAQPHVYPKDIENLKIDLPSKEEQLMIAEVLKSADQEISILENDLKETLEQKRGLMQQLLTGKKQVVV